VIGFGPVKFAQGTVDFKGSITNKSMARFSCFTWTGGTGECWICQKQRRGGVSGGGPALGPFF